VSIQDKLKELGIELPPPPQAVGSYLPAVRTGNQLFVSGQLPMVDGKLIAEEIVGDSVTDKTAVDAMRRATLNSLAVADAFGGGLDNIARVLRVVGYVACTPSFKAQPAITNGASDLLVEIFGEAGKHARAAVGVCALPLGSPVELEVLYELKA
jgi:enamine deaminase RidA (YjgF/YER057c/UK114 family)